MINTSPPKAVSLSFPFLSFSFCLLLSPIVSLTIFALTETAVIGSLCADVRRRIRKKLQLFEFDSIKEELTCVNSNKRENDENKMCAALCSRQERVSHAPQFTLLETWDGKGNWYLIVFQLKQIKNVLLWKRTTFNSARNKNCN